MAADTIVQTIALTKRYNGFTAVDRLNLEVKEGEIFGFLGPNGAGKTTSILMLLGLTEPTEGTAKVCGFNPTHEPLQVKRITGYLPEQVGFYEELTGRENLRYITRLNNVRRKEAEARIEEALALVDLGGVADKKVDTYSHGMKQRLGVADVLVKSPRLVFLDEPTQGIDPDGVNRMLELITRMSEQGITVVLSSHLLHQVQRICHRIAILAKGKMVACGPIQELARKAVAGDQMALELEVFPKNEGVLAGLRGLDGVSRVEVSGEQVLLHCDKDVRGDLTQALAQNGAELLAMRVLGYGLEEIYLRYFREE